MSDHTNPVTAGRPCIELMDLFTGDKAAVKTDTPRWGWVDDHALTYNWADGNWTCDCNRWEEWVVARGGKPDSGHAQEESLICGEPRIRARFLHVAEPFDDWPKNEEERIRMAEALKKSRKAHEDRYK